MRFIILRTNTSDFGKIGTYNVQEVGLAQSLIKKGHKVFVLYLNRSTSSIIQDERYNFVYYLPHKKIGLHGIFNVDLLDQFNPHKIILFSDNQLWAKNVINWCRIRNIPCVQYMGAVLSDNKNFLNQFYTKLILLRNKNTYRYSINVAKTTKAQKEMERYGIKVSKVINVGLDDSLLQEVTNPNYPIKNELGYKKEERIILFVGRLVDYKRPLLAVDILKKLLELDKNFRLLMIGQGELKTELIRYITKHNLNEKIKVIDRVPYSEMYKYMVASDFFINLSSKEIFGMAILEAMYYRLPVVAHVAPGPNEIICDSSTGFLIDSINPREWADTIKKADVYRSEIGKKSRESIKKKFLWDNISEEFIKVF